MDDAKNKIAPATLPLLCNHPTYRKIKRGVSLFGPPCRLYWLCCASFTVWLYWSVNYSAMRIRHYSKKPRIPDTSEQSPLWTEVYTELIPASYKCVVYTVPVQASKSLMSATRRYVVRSDPRSRSRSRTRRSESCENGQFQSLSSPPLWM